MTSPRLRRALCAAPLLLGLAAPVTPAAAAAPGAVRAGVQVPVLAGGSAAATLADGPATSGSRPLARTATFRVTYTGFPPAARAAFQRAVDVWATEVSSPVPITVDARFAPLGPGVLGWAGPARFRRDFPGAPRPGTWYAEAAANARAGRQLDPGADIEASFSSSDDRWSFAATPAPQGRYDFSTVVLHELGHGLGFLGLGDVNSGKGTIRLAEAPSAWDRATVGAGGRPLLRLGDPSVVLARQLSSGSVWFDTPDVRRAGGGRAARLYAPATFEKGSSYSHLDDATYPQGSADALMTHAIADGETIRRPGPVTLAVLRATGW